MLEFWNDRYNEDDYAYGEEPNAFYKGQLSKLTPGKILLPAEGEGRNAVFAAKMGWDVIAFDQSESGKNKALGLAAQEKVKIDFSIDDLNHFDYHEESFDAVAMIYVHMPGQMRTKVHQKLFRMLKPGGTLILEGFNKEHLKFNSENPKAGGPKTIDLLFSYEELKSDFCDMEILFLEETVTHLNEGNYHVGESAVIRLIARKN